MKCCGSPWPEVILYVAGMFFVIFGTGALIVSVDPWPLGSDTWTSFLAVGIAFLLVGSILLVLSATIPELPSKTFSLARNRRRNFLSAVDLLEDVQSVSCGDSPIIKLREGRLRMSEDSVRTIKSCMMLQTPFSGTEGILYYKETIV